jgi:hypothetical protein
VPQVAGQQRVQPALEHGGRGGTLEGALLSRHGARGEHKVHFWASSIKNGSGRVGALGWWVESGRVGAASHWLIMISSHLTNLRASPCLFR